MRALNKTPFFEKILTNHLSS